MKTGQRLRDAASPILHHLDARGGETVVTPLARRLHIKLVEFGPKRGYQYNNGPRAEMAAKLRLPMVHFLVAK
ncbi:hypothetical protein Y032_0008g87 [Ancylostoma ceylanicum]|uniref:Uncharacterized protein n=1 Tax=Ancylostoma ceylanicum TaxID=53326 RepID=A0A016VMP6_9BILA|nr:hypothetical protein Y032_0008g87 [Ancylostoma ceylanicum]